MDKILLAFIGILVFINGFTAGQVYAYNKATRMIKDGFKRIGTRFESSEWE